MAGCKKPEPPDSKNFPAPVEFTTIGQCFLDIGYIEELANKGVVITSSSEWELLKERLHDPYCSVGDYLTKEIDFSVYQIVAVFEEIKGSGGYDIEITGITEYADKIIVKVEHFRPNGPAFTVDTQPFHIVTMPISEKEIVFEHVEDSEQSSIENIIWKLNGIVDVETNEMKILEPQDCDECYTITFHADGMFGGRSTSNILNGDYEIDYKTGVLFFTLIGGSESIEHGDGFLYRDALKAVQSFKTDDANQRLLRLYYNDGKNYLEYRVLIDLAEYGITDILWKLTGLVDTETGEMKILDPQGYDDGYTVMFKAKGEFSGRITNNEIYGGYYVDYFTGGFFFFNLWGTEAGEYGDATLYRQAFEKTESFKIENADSKILRLYYDGGKNYLEYRAKGE
jgi:hypothetical protein